ncbi:hypothetical protein APS56_15070 [Pseudalgibacter alginicilyticus]|uniref:Secretion system C-terminal sorting domain-containing protein n=1 Tax=Pseudalgibacter alginicilyticus TaxID=1736674 RepID=A0A0P0D617_9FLAO|nr:T9SS type A sorting domain-containing protein [Pseudalgibacter alginicilyticus]ALJ06376.1 hypothetical protein APS56_15070 [Pseudalgibacter alginicilyticus]
MKTKLFLLSFLFLVFSEIKAQVTLPYYEPFDYPEGSLLVSNEGNLGPWLSTYTGNTNGDPLIVTSPTWFLLPNQLAFTQVGEAVGFQGGSDDPVITFAPQGDEGFIYSSFIFKVTDQSDVTDTAGGFIYSFGKVNSENNGYNYCSAVYLRKTSETTFNIGVSETNSASKAAWSATEFTLDQEVFIIIAYDIAGQLSKMWINPDISGLEPAVTLDTTADTDTGSRDDIVVVRISLEGNSRTPSTILDEIRIGNTWQSVTDQPELSVSKNELESNINIFPNPANDYITINTKNDFKVSSIEMFSLLGQKVLTQTELKNNQLNVSNLTRGVYLLKVSADGGSFTKKIVIE